MRPSLRTGNPESIANRDTLRGIAYSALGGAVLVLAIGQLLGNSERVQPVPAPAPLEQTIIHK